MTSWKENVRILGSRRMEDVPAILDELASITLAIAEIRKTEAPAFVLFLAKRVLLLGKHTSIEVQQQARVCLQTCFGVELDVIREEIVAKRLLRSTS